MIQHGKPSAETKDSSSPRSVIPSNLTTMDVKTPNCLQSLSIFPSHKESPLEGNPNFFSKNKENPFADTFSDPLCKLNLKETSDFVKAFPMAKNSVESRAFLENSAQRRRESCVAQRRVETPSTPGRPVFSFSVGNLSKKSFPSKWDNAEKWLISTSCHESPAHVIKPPEPCKISEQNEIFQQKVDDFAEKFRVAEENVSSSLPSFNGTRSLESNLVFNGVSSDVLLKDKFTDNVEPIFHNFRYPEQMKEGFLFGNSVCETMKDAATEVIVEVHHRDIGTEMTPLCSSKTSRCHTPFKSSSPARHNTPTNISGPLVASNTSVNFSELQDFHFSKLDLGTQLDSVVSNWSSKEEEEEEISKSLRHFEMGGCRKSVVESRASVWEDEEKGKSCFRYQREEAKIQAWVNLQSAKAEAQSRKLEVKIEKMRSNLEEKLMRRMAIVHRRAEEWRTSAHLQHSQQIQRASEQAQKMKTQQHYIPTHTSSSCGCFPCNRHF
ncbi:remorin family protein [Tasmannia lanceolata]|uniref:remorin family protein n=1 Tax=Tasmannia lanceolata TaxID=3420 RepID=UPI00406388E7